jgi:purine-binding chemotaxis protein CheW
MTTRQYATFEVANQLFGLDVTHVQEVLSFDQYTPVPLAPSHINGLFNLRGQVIAAIDLRVQLGLTPRPATNAATTNVIVRTNDEPLSLLVDRIGEVITLSDSASEPPPDTLTGPSRRHITHAFKLDNTLLLALDPATLNTVHQDSA